MPLSVSHSLFVLLHLFASAITPRPRQIWASHDFGVPNGIEVDEVKVKATKEWPTHTQSKELSWLS